MQILYIFLKLCTILVDIHISTYKNLLCIGKEEDYADQENISIISTSWDNCY